MKIRSIAYSKINLFLKVTGKRPDGYHEILSFFLPLTSPADHIVLTVDDLTVLYGIEIICRDKRIPTDETNICHQAATRYAAMTGLPAKWRIEIDKKIRELLVVTAKPSAVTEVVDDADDADGE